MRRNSLILSFFVVVIAGIAMPAAASQTQALAIGAPSIGSVMYTQAAAISEVMQKYDHLASSVEATGGAYANMFSLGASRVDLAIGNALAAYQAYHAIPPFKKRIDLRLLAPGQESLRFIIVRRGAGIRTFRDLIGKRIVARRPSNPELWWITRALLKVYGIRAEKLNVITTTNTNETLSDVQAGTIDAAMVPMARHAATLNQLLREGQARILRIPKRKLERALAMLPKAFTISIVRKGAFYGVTRPTAVLALRAVLVGRATLPNDVAYEITKTLFREHKQLVLYHPAFRQWTLSRAMKDVPLPYAPGAIEYFKQKGVWGAQMAAEQAELLKR